MTGRLEILNLGYGHLTIAFDGTDPNAVETARKAINDMLSRNYLIIVKDDKGVEHKVTEFNPEINVYVIKEINGTLEIPLTEGQATAIPPIAGG